MQEEKTLQKKILKALGSRTDTRVFQNDVGMGYHGTLNLVSGLKVLTNPTPFRYGLQVGVSDIIGLRKTLITPEMIGREIAVFLALEVKTASGKASPEQENFIAMVKHFGGIADFVRSVEEAEETISWTIS